MTTNEWRHFTCQLSRMYTQPLPSSLTGPALPGEEYTWTRLSSGSSPELLKILQSPGLRQLPSKNPEMPWPKLLWKTGEPLTFFRLSEEASVLRPPPPAVPGLPLLGKLQLHCIRSLREPLGLRKGLLQRGLSLAYSILIGLGHKDPCPVSLPQEFVPQTFLPRN